MNNPARILRVGVLHWSQRLYPSPSRRQHSVTLSEARPQWHTLWLSVNPFCMEDTESENVRPSENVHLPNHAYTSHYACGPVLGMAREGQSWVHKCIAIEIFSVTKQIGG